MKHTYFAVVCDTPNQAVYAKLDRNDIPSISDSELLWKIRSIADPDRNVSVALFTDDLANTAAFKIHVDLRRDKDKLDHRWTSLLTFL